MGQAPEEGQLQRHGQKAQLLQRSWKRSATRAKLGGRWKGDHGQQGLHDPLTLPACPEVPTDMCFICGEATRDRTGVQVV